MLNWLVKFVGKIGSTGEIELISTQVLIRRLQACRINLESDISASVILAGEAL